MIPIKKEAKEIHIKELALFRNYYLNTKRDLKNGTAKASIPKDENDVKTDTWKYVAVCV
jgi:hypothetical protein